MMMPVGPVVVFSASNFPLAFSVAGGDTASALAAGCPVIVKPHHAHLGTSEMVGLIVQQAVADARAPEGAFSMLYGEGRDIGIALVKHPIIKAVGFTGSRVAGRALMDAAAARPEPIPVYAEMGSINPIFIFKGALESRADEIAAGLHASVTLGVGQFCTNPGLVLVETGRGMSAWLSKLTSLMAATPVGTMLTAGLCENYRTGVSKFSAIHGVSRLVDFEASKTQGAAQAGAALFKTDAQTFLDHSDLMHEVFGPSTLVVECDTREQMMAIATRMEGQLTATIHAQSSEWESLREFVDQLGTRAGRLLFNGFPTGVEVTHAMTHGGPYPATSDGRSTSVGTRAIERFLRPVSYQNFPDALLPAELLDDNPLKIARLEDGKPNV
jgi:NADP-dependent aldehyde dehydrogenase